MLIDPTVSVPTVVGISVLVGIACYGIYNGTRGNTGPMEHAFIGKGMLALWLLVTCFLTMLFALPMPYAHLLWVPYVAVLLALGLYCRRKSRQLRVTDFNSPTQ